ncbi:Beta-xylosidase [Lachnospiraceae bacterium NLAE-zl-G231]|nr:Beta-xylosidase [Lachnospiraceae bacterium NLAE-zl-G231]
MFQELVHKADLGNGYYLNPILDGDYADPAVFRDGETYYLTVSTGEYRPGLSIFQSGDLVNWKLICHPLHGFMGAAWAPDILKYEGKYYIYFCSGGTNWVIWSEHIDSGWSEAIDLKVGHIDPGHVVDGEGNRYLFLSENYIVPLSRDGLSVTGEMIQVLKAPEIPDEWDIEGAFPEAPNVFRKDGYYYLTYADGGTAGPATSHMIMSARAESLYGPWELSPYNPVVHTYSRYEKWLSKGHGHFVEDTEGKWWAIYHSYEKGYESLGRKLLLSPVEFTRDGWFRISKPAEEATPKPCGYIVEDTNTFSDNFSGKGISGWRAWGESNPARYHCLQKGLRIDGTGETIGKSHPLTIITGDHSYETTVHVTCHEGCEAGIILQYNEEIYNAAALRDGKLCIYRLGKMLAQKDIGTNECWLRMKNDDQYISFYYSLDGVTYKKMNYCINAISQNNNSYNGFLSLRPGIFAAGKGYANWEDFTYTGLI